MATMECGEMPVGWSGAWETLWWRFVKVGMCALEDELMIQ